MNLKSSFSKKFSKEATISILGPSKAGKTTFTRFLETGEPQLEEPATTLGVDYRKKGVQINNVSFTLIDVGGQKIFQDIFWDIAIQKSHGIIFIVDATINPQDHKDRFRKQIDQLDYVLNIVNEDIVILLLLNKQDLTKQNPISPSDFMKYVKSERLKNTTVGLLPTSAKFGDGVLDAVGWLIDQLFHNPKIE